MKNRDLIKILIIIKTKIKKAFSFMTKDKFQEPNGEF